jgi:hypothetical protein
MAKGIIIKEENEEDVTIDLGDKSKDCKGLVQYHIVK